MRLCSINSATSYGPLEARGETLDSGFYKKQRQDDYIFVQGLGSDVRATFSGDDDRAVLLYQTEAYDYWRGEIDHEDGLPYGILGENLTFDGPGDEAFHVGDWLRVGGCVLEINQPRFPCFKLGARFADPGLPLRYLRSGRLGFFCRVVEAGPVRVGDAITPLRATADAEPVSIAEFARVMTLETRDVEGLERLLASKYLSTSWRIKAERLLRRACGLASRWLAYQDFTVASRRPANRAGTVVSIGLKAPVFDDSGDDHLPVPEGGQFVTLELPIEQYVDGHSNGLVRCYTISAYSAPVQDEPGTYYIDVKRKGGTDPDDPPGPGSGYLHSDIAVGDRIRALGARGTFVVEPNARPLVLCSAGIGITPMLAMLEEQATSPNCREVHFLHGARNGDEAVGLDRVRRLVEGSDRLHSCLAYSRPSQRDLAEGAFDRVGRVTTEMVGEIVPGLDADFYLCGPAPFLRDVVTGLSALGVSRDRLHFEFFGATEILFPGDLERGEQMCDDNGDPILVTFLDSGTTEPLTDRDLSVLTVARRAGVNPAVSCETGVCGTCRAPLRGGTVEYNAEPAVAPEPGELLICCAVPKTSVTVGI